MLAHTIHGARDLRLEAHDERALAADEVRLELAFGGICGTDIHYYNEGRVGNSIVRDPMILGHELSARVVDTGTQIDDIERGAPVVVDPSLPCGQCRQCIAGRTNLCAAMRYLGSAAFRPHTAGGFQQRPVVKRSQCIAVAADADLQLAALSEPYAIALHAISRANVSNANVLITGAGTVGTLVAFAARRAGAAALTITDLDNTALERARLLSGADTINVGETPLDSTATPLGPYDVAIEASGSTAAFNSALYNVAPGARVVQVGFVNGDGLDLNRLITGELEIHGAYRFVDEFETAVHAVIAEPNLKQVITSVFDFRDCEAAYAAAGDKSSNLKVLLQNS
ncbi:alcohol dehydrogenase catalytic domain-containing protein [Salinisphaera sp. USBA-960]|uniref:alcohol dehydrogenase catalytic domain-containing protein n=1 Tax=Salinisphaera orenii TaxID=856731 RepID=UPI000DBE6C8A|nr:alcohol dehydrogenase catalytic domain-containing protein [Salifodinibacter halophilus]NNC25675.1 alcohol dehydrogenase catalytic domain-containing protein [Salifodinibacter halophilus]